MIDNELKHYGVMGMKWGHRKGQTNTTKSKKVNTETEEERKKRIQRNILIGAAAVGVTLAVAGSIYVAKKNNVPLHVSTIRLGHIVDVDKLSTKDFVLPKDSKFYRMSSKSFEDYSQDGKRIYITTIKKDARLYKHVMPDYYKSWASKGIISDDGKKAYEHTMKANKDIKIASKRFMADAYMEATGHKEIDEGQYTQFMTNLVSDHPNVTKFLNIVKSSGYNAIVDENDIGTYAKMPLILLDPKNDVVTSKVSKVTKISKVINVLLM